MLISTPAKILLRLLFLLPTLLCGAICAEEICVPADYNTIQEGIDAASFGDMVLVNAGTYSERIVLKNGVVVRSSGTDAKGKLGLKRAELTIIDGGKENGSGGGR